MAGAAAATRTSRASRPRCYCYKLLLLRPIYYLLLLLPIFYPGNLCTYCYYYYYYYYHYIYIYIYVYIYIWYIYIYIYIYYCYYQGRGAPGRAERGARVAEGAQRRPRRGRLVQVCWSSRIILAKS